MEVFFSQKNDSKFFCEICDYYTSNKKDFSKHNLTSKHKKRENGSILEIEEEKKSLNHSCQCGRNFLTNGGLWKHRQKCNLSPNDNLQDLSDVKVLTNLVLEVVKQNQELALQNSESYKQNQELQKQVIELCKNGTSNTSITNNNSHNKTFNLNVFLNETCKDAMNITDFVDSLKLQVSDLERVGELGYIEGISSIIVRNLKELDVTQRPVHCTDKKRETIYIKDENKWEKDEDNKKMHKLVRKVADKNARLLPKFKEKYPDYNKSSSRVSDQYNKIIIESMGGAGDNDYEKEEKIIKKVSREITVEK
jgi:hypothetical protein